MRTIVSGSKASHIISTGSVEENWRGSLRPIARVGGRIQLCRLADLPDSGIEGALPNEKVYILIYPSPVAAAEPVGHIERLTITPGKKGQHELLSSVLPRAVAFALKHLTRDGKDLVIACEDGKDASIGVTVALLQLFFDDIGLLRDKPTRCMHPLVLSRRPDIY